MNNARYTAIDLFAGCGGMSTGLERAGFKILASIEIDPLTANTYRRNHSSTTVISDDIRNVGIEDLQRITGSSTVDLVAGCPPCQGFSSIRRLNKPEPSQDERNSLILEYLRIVEGLMPHAILMENVPALQEYHLFKKVAISLEAIGYKLAYGILDASNYGVPQRRKRFVMIGSRVGTPQLPIPLKKAKTVRDAIGQLNGSTIADDPLQHIHSHHGERIAAMIKRIPKDGGSMADLPEAYRLKCHKKGNVGFSDVYGRMSWDKVSPTITGGCLNPSKGRFLHPEMNRSITAREAALLQTFPPTYHFPDKASREKIALMIGNALPPDFALAQANVVATLLDQAREHDSAPAEF